MSEVMVNLKGTELGDRLQIDMISVESLVAEFEDTLYQMDNLKEELKEATRSEIEKYEDWKWEQADLYNDEVKMGIRE